jgi:hypothetical protein
VNSPSLEGVVEQLSKACRGGWVGVWVDGVRGWILMDRWLTGVSGVSGRAAFSRRASCGRCHGIGCWDGTNSLS